MNECMVVDINTCMLHGGYKHMGFSKGRKGGDGVMDKLPWALNYKINSNNITQKVIAMNL